jgi:DNA-binding transcriptional ArsR family regulator
MSEDPNEIQKINSESVTDELEQNFYIKMRILQDPITFKIFILLLTFHELSLTQLTQKIGNSKSTTLRHLNKLIDANFVIESREEKVHSSKPAKYYRPKLDNFQPKNDLNATSLEKLSYDGRIRLYKEICSATGVSINFMKSTLDDVQKYLENKTPQEIQDYVLAPDIVLGLNLMSEKAYHKWLEVYQKAMLEFYQSMQEELMNPETEKPFALMLGFVPLKKIYGSPDDNPSY